MIKHLIVQNKIVRIIAFFISLFLLFGSIFSLVQDILYFSSRTETTARIMSIENLGTQEPYRIFVEYFNKYSGKEMSCNVLLKKTHRVKIDEINKGYANIYYSKYMPCSIYFVEYNAPTLGVLFIDGIMIVLMSIAVLAFKDGFKKGNVSKELVKEKK